MPICEDYAPLNNPEVFAATSEDGSVTITPAGLRGHRPDFSVNFPEGGSISSNVLDSSGNTMTSTVDALSDTATIINSVSNTSLVNTLSTTVNGITGSTVQMINTLGLNSSVNTMSSTINGINATAAIVNSNSLTASASALISSVNGISSTLTPSSGTIAVNLGFSAGGALVTEASAGSTNAQMFTDSTPTQVTNATNITESAEIRRSGKTVIGSTSVTMTDANAKLKVVGNIELDTSASTTGNITKGGARFLHNYGTNNTFLGINSGNFTTTGTGQNVGVGFEALLSISSGVSATAIGHKAFSAVTTNSNNTGLGDRAGTLSTGFQNTAIGSLSYQSAVTANNGTAVGYSSLALATGSSNTSLGSFSGYNIVAGSSNVFVGYNSGNSGSQAIAAQNSIAIGANTFTTASNQAVLGDNNITSTLLKGVVTLNNVIKLNGYTVATLPVGVVGYECYVTDALAPAYNAIAVGGGAVTCKVFYNGTNWIT